jgi:AP-1 complex subunit mu
LISNFFLLKKQNKNYQKVLFELQGRATKKKAVDLNDIKFHQCVKLTKFENERVISFVPPDGEFELISYRLDVAVKPLFMVEVQIKNLSK